MLLIDNCCSKLASNLRLITNQKNRTIKRSFKAINAVQVEWV